MSKWLPPHGFTCKVQQMDARVGGTFRMSFLNFSSGHSHSSGGEYLGWQESLEQLAKLVEPGIRD
jgi:uncharacterized protein YndB with AHSA1/START domain